MKIEMGESLFYSWLRHVKECQIVQTNWKSSNKWTFNNSEEIEEMFHEIDKEIKYKYNYKVFKKNASLAQVVLQGECDVLGINFTEGAPTYYAVDVAFHEYGLNYGSNPVTVSKVISKCVRTAFCLYGFFGAKAGEIVFASPKIGKSVRGNLVPTMEFINEYFKSKGFSFNFRLICNEEFKENVIDPIILVSGEVADTSELFMRSYQLLNMFTYSTVKKETKTAKKVKTTATVSTEVTDYSELKIGQIVQLFLADAINNFKLSNDEIKLLFDEGYCKRAFNIGYPLLSKTKARHYYAKPYKINGEEYYICCEWFDRSRDIVINYIEKSKKM